MKLQILFAILFAFALSAESEYIDGSYIIQLKDGSTEAHIEEVIEKIEGHTLSSREDMEITSNSLVFPLIFGKFDKETAEMVSGLESVELVEQDQVVTIEMPYESTEEISTDDEYEDTDDTVTDQSDYDDSDESDDNDSDQSDYNDSDQSDDNDSDQSDNDDSLEVDEIEEYNSTHLERRGRYRERRRYNLDIIDNKRCRNNYFTPKSYGKRVDIYILDTGIRYNHKDFRGRRARYGGFDIQPRNRGWDRQGHGTHCAGIAGGRYSGVAKRAMLYSIRVLNSKGSGSYSGIMKGILHAYSRHLTRVGRRGFKGSVMSMSLGGGYSRTVNNVVNAVVAKGVTIVTASGNGRKDACRSSPGSAGRNINVGAHGYYSRGCRKPMYSRSNYGKCVHIVAPGVNVLSANYKGRSRFTKKTGTSMACPHVAGTAALMLQKKKLSPAAIKYRIQRCAMNDLYKRKDYTRRLYVTRSLWK